MTSLPVCFVVLALLAASGADASVLDTFFGEIPLPAISPREFNVVDYGAKGDGVATNTAAFCAAVEACEGAGGGTIVIPEGEYLTGPVHLRSNIRLDFRDATLVFTDRVDDYLPPVEVNWEGTECLNYSPLVYAVDATNVALTGSGTLAARTDAWFARFNREHGDGTLKSKVDLLRKWGEDGIPLAERDATKGAGVLRPSLLLFKRCRNILIDGVGYEQSPMWCYHLVHCENVVCRNFRCRARGHNSDGIDPEGTRNMLVENVVFDVGDDCMAIKSGRDFDGRRAGRASENIEVRNCTYLNGHSMLAIGSELSGGVRNVWAHDNKVVNCATLCYMKSNRARGGVVENVRVSDVDVDCCYVQLCGLSLEYSPNPYAIERHGVNHTKFRGFTMENVKAKYCARGISIVAAKENRASGFTFRNITAGRADDTNLVFENVDDLEIGGVRLGTYRPLAERGVLALTFDGREPLKSRERALALFERYGAHATFFIPGHFDKEAVALAKGLEARGHTIGLGGLNNRRAAEFLAEGGTAEQYIREEIEPQIAEAKSAGFDPKFWAYPGNDCNAETDYRIAYWFFRRNRAGGSMESATIPVHLLTHRGSWRRTLHSMALDAATDYGALLKHLEKVADENLCLSTFSRHIAGNHDGTSCPADELERILKRAQELGIRVLGFDELGE